MIASSLDQQGDWAAWQLGLAHSGSPLQIAVDHHGDGEGTVDLVDTPRAYDFLVESTQLDWTFSVEEVYEAYATEPSGPPR